MKEVKKIHERSMDFYDMAKMAKIKGDLKHHRPYLEEAYLLEREAALKAQSYEKEEAWRFMLLRSAGWLALECGYLEEAQMLGELGLAGNPAGIYKHELDQLLEKIRKGFSINETVADQNIDSLTTLLGTVSYADAEQTNIKIKESSSSDYHTVSVPPEMFQMIVRSYFGEAVEVALKKNKKGLPVLQHIRRAA